MGDIEILDMESQSNELKKIAGRLEKSEEKDGLVVEKVYKEILQLFILEQIITGSIFLMNIRSKKRKFCSLIPLLK